MYQGTPAPASSPSNRPRKVFVPASWTPVFYDDDPNGPPSFWQAATHGPVSSTWAPDEHFRFCIEDGPGDLHLNEAEELLGRLSAALAAARSAGNRIAEGLAAELRGRREAIAPAGFTAPERDEIDGSLLSFDLPDFGPVSTSWDPEDGFGYSIDNSLFLDGPGARRIEAALQQVLLAARSSQRRMDDMWARWQAGEDLEAEIQWR